MVKRGFADPATVIIGLSFLVFLVGVLSSGDFIAMPTVLLDVENVGVVGRGESNMRKIPLGNAEIDFREEPVPSIEERGPITVARGIITVEEHKVSFELSEGELERISSSKVGFDVLKTNRYGKMILRLNGNLIWSGEPDQGERVEVDLGSFKDFCTTGINTLQFSSTSSGWRIWAPSIYVIDNFRLEANVLKTSQKDFEFSVSDIEIEKWMLGRVVFTVKDAGFGTDLLVKINNVTVWRGSPKPGNLPTLVDFSNLVTGIGKTNSLSFGVERPGRYDIRGVEVLVFNSGEGTSASTQQFNITQENLEMLRQGRLKGVVEFYVGDVGSQGSLSVSLIGDDELLLMEESVGTGKVELSFTDAEVRRGTNLLIIKSSGLYELGSLKIKLVNR